MSFTKAEPVSPYFKASMYGNPGTGKTMTALLFAEGLAAHRKKRVAFVDTESGTRFYRQTVKERAIHPEAFDFDIFETRSIAEIFDAVSSLDLSVHGVVIIDSISHLWEGAREAYVSRNGLGLDDDIPLRAWAKIKSPYKSLLKLISVEGQFDSIVIGRQKTIFGTDPVTDKLVNEGVGMRAESETQYEPDICIHMQQVGRRGTEGVVTLFGEKDRSGILQGRTLPDPSFECIKPFLAYLGDTAPVIDDKEARTEKDAAMADDVKVEKKREKSRELFASFAFAIHAASDVTELGTAGREVKKKKRSMVQDDIDALTTLYEQKRSDLATAEAGAL